MNQSGFSILENVFILAFVLMTALWTNTRFLQSRSLVANGAARLKFEEEILRLMQVTKEDSICERLNFVKSGVFVSNQRKRLASYDEIKLDGTVLVKKGKRPHYEIKSLTLDQDSPVFGLNPTRVQAYISLVADFYDQKGKTIERVNWSSKNRGVALVLVADANGQVVGCYGSFSRRLACEDAQGTYDREATPNCKI